MPELFKGGILEMSTSPLSADAAGRVWADCLVNRLAVMLAIILLLITITDIIRLAPSLLKCFVNWKTNLELEHSVNAARTRNNVSFFMGVITCLIADRWGLVAPSFKLALAPGWQLAVTAAILFGFMLLRYLLYLVTRFRSSNNEFANTVRHSLFNYHILLTVFALVSALVLAGFRVPDATVRTILIIESVLFWLKYLVSYVQILGSRCNSLATILYLCALEILPIGILVFVCTL